MNDGLRAFASLIGLTAFLWLFLNPWRDLCVSVARQKMFEKRDALFDLALNGVISFDDPSYKTIRSCIEGMIRYAHRLDFMSFLTFLLFEKSLGSDVSATGGKETALQKALAALPERERLIVGELVDGAMRASLILMIERSIVLLPVYALIRGFGIAFKLGPFLRFVGGTMEKQVEFSAEFPEASLV